MAAVGIGKAKAIRTKVCAGIFYDIEANDLSERQLATSSQAVPSFHSNVACELAPRTGVAAARLVHNVFSKIAFVYLPPTRPAHLPPPLPQKLTYNPPGPLPLHPPLPPTTTAYFHHRLYRAVKREKVSMICLDRSVTPSQEGACRFVIYDYS